VVTQVGKDGPGRRHHEGLDMKEPTMLKMKEQERTAVASADPAKPHGGKDVELGTRILQKILDGSDVRTEVERLKREMAE
jgi:hypothetical protein